MGSAVEPPRSWTAASVTIAVAAVVPVLLTVVVALVAAVEPGGIVRLCVTALVYTPVAVLALSVGRRDVVALAAGLAVCAGWAALTVTLRVANREWVTDSVLLLVLGASNVAEMAALGLLPWLAAGGARRHPRGTGIALGGVAMAAVLAVTGLFTRPPVVLYTGVLVWALTSFAVGIVVLVRRWRGGGPRLRAVSGWLGVGAATLAVSYLRLVAPMSQQANWLLDAAFVLAQVFLSIGLLAAITEVPLRPRDRDTLALVLALTLSVGSYLAVTGALRAIGVPGATAGALAAGTLALVLGTAFRVVRDRLDVLFAGPVPDARGVLARLGERVGASGPGQLHDIASALRETWGLDSVEITIPTMAVQVRTGRPTAEAISVPLASGGRQIGTIRVSGPDRHALDTDVHPVLSSTSGLVAVAVQLAVTNEEVDATRRRTLDVRREERKILHGHLHDTLAPALAGLGFAMTAADRLLAAGDPRFIEVLDDLRVQVGACTQEVRQLARVLLPTALDQGDLEAALHELAATVRRDGIEVEVTAPAADALDADLQLGLYLLLAEALLVAAREANVASVRVSLAVDDSVARARLQMCDASGPVPSEPVARAVAARVEELGGRVATGGPGEVEAVLSR